MNIKQVNEFLKEKNISEDLVVINNDGSEILLDQLLTEYTYSIINDYKRLAADFENYKKRVHNDKKNDEQRLKSKLYNDLFELEDELNISLKHIKNKKQSEAITTFSNKLDTILKRNGMNIIETTEYDPNLHEVVHVVKGERKGIDVVSNGYKIDNSIIRYPKVILYENNN